LISFLGYIIFTEGITTDLAKIKKVANFSKL